MAEEQAKIPGRPEDNGWPYFITASLYPLDKGTLDTIIQPQYNRHDSYDLFIMPQFSYGLTDNWQIFTYLVPYIIHENEEGQRTSGNGDIDIGTEYSWMYIDKSDYSAAIYLNLHLPTGDINRDLTDGFIRYMGSILFAKDFPHRNSITQLFGQAGFEFVQRVKHHANSEEDDPAAHVFVLNGGIAQRYETINYSLELNWSTNTWNNGGNENKVYVTPGVYMTIKKNTAIGLGIPIGLTHDADRYEIIANLLVDIETIPKKTDDKDNDDQKTNIDKQGKITKLDNSINHRQAYS
jgi:hypothetical protein